MCNLFLFSSVYYIYYNFFSETRQVKGSYVEFQIKQYLPKGKKNLYYSKIKVLCIFALSITSNFKILRMFKQDKSFVFWFSIKIP